MIINNLKTARNIKQTARINNAHDFHIDSITATGLKFHTLYGTGEITRIADKGQKSDPIKCWKGTYSNSIMTHEFTLETSTLDSAFGMVARKLSENGKAF
ncbi:MAG: hypothetical protein KC496_03590 [Anaerolineae bacterium]|nr:hypothetical protein [Anaerolineae bacterium]